MRLDFLLGITHYYPSSYYVNITLYKGGIIMYRNCKYNNCCNYASTKKEEVIEDACDNVMPYMMNKHDECECGFDEDECPFPQNPMFGHSYVPNQKMTKTFVPSVALKMGTLFPELVSPYVPMQSWIENEYLQKCNKVMEGCNNV
jgi:hypothetical protein